MVKKVVILSGAPGSGKSYVANHLMKDNDVWLSRDKVRTGIRQAINSNDYFPVTSTTEDQIWHSMVKEMIWQSDADTLYIDQTTLNWRAFTKLWDGVRLDAAGVPVTFMRLDVPLKVCLERNSKRTGFERVPDSSLINMWESFQKSKEQDIPAEFQDKVVVVHLKHENS